MNKCLCCGEPVKNKFCNVTCQNKYQGSENANKRFGIIKEFKVNCKTCGKEILIYERDKLFPTKENYFCNRSCANKRILSNETKDLIRQSLIKDNTVNLICEYCKKEFIIKYFKRNQKCCSKECSSKLVNERTRIKKQNKNIIKIKKEIPSNKITFIYSLEYPLGNIRYIGKSDTPEARLDKHISEAKNRNKNYKDHWINSINDKPILNILEQVTYSNWQEREIYWIKLHTDNGFKLVNGTKGGEGSNGFEGRHHTEEAKEKIKENRKFQVFSEESKLKITGENNGKCKLSDNDVREIFKLAHVDNITHKEIAKQFNIARKYVFILLTGIKRKNIYNEYVNNLNKSSADGSQTHISWL